MFNNTLDKKYPRPFTFLTYVDRIHEISSQWKMELVWVFFKKPTSLCKINVFFVAQWDL